jgi:general secretion pathway protein G
MVKKTSRRNGFTLIELLVVLAILALLVTLAAPRYFGGVDRAKEATLRSDLRVVREAIDQYYGDRSRYPERLEDLVEEGYIRQIPQDPLTESTQSWIVVPPKGEEAGSVYDIHSGAAGAGKDGIPYAEW